MRKVKNISYGQNTISYRENTVSYTKFAIARLKNIAK